MSADLELVRIAKRLEERGETELVAAVQEITAKFKNKTKSSLAKAASFIAKHYKDVNTVDMMNNIGPLLHKHGHISKDWTMSSLSSNWQVRCREKDNRSSLPKGCRQNGDSLAALFFSVCRAMFVKVRYRKTGTYQGRSAYG